MIMQEISYIKVDDTAKLDLLIDVIRSLTDEDFISLDTEFVRINTLFPILGLLQLRLKGKTYLVDPVVLNVKDLVKELTQTKAAMLIFSGDEDLEILVKIAKDKLAREKTKAINSLCMQYQGFADAYTEYKTAVLEAHQRLKSNE